MRIIIAGAGEVGFHLAKMLSQESHDITIIDLDENRLKRAEANIDVSTLKGNAFSPRILEASNVQTADLFVAVTSSEETNIATAIVSKKMGAKHTIARIRNPEFQNKEIKESFKALGIDSMVFPEQLASREIERLIYRSELTDYFEFSGGKLTLSGIVLDKKAPLINKNLIQASKIIKDLKFVVVAIQRGSQTLIPRGDTRFQPRDHIYVIAHKEKLNDIIYLAGQVHTNIRNIMILGGGRIGRLLAKRIQHKFNVKLIEKVQDRCFGIADELVKTLVIHGDGSDVELLVDENVDGMDAFIAVTGDSEINIISCLVAKSHGVNRSIALVENIDYINLSLNMGVDTLINKKLIAVNNIFRFVRQGQVEAITSLHGIESEVLEFIVKPQSHITKAPIKSLDFPRSAIIGGVVRGAQSLIPSGAMFIEPGDRVVVFTLPETIHEVESFFK